jgi:hypothetical protein
VNLIVENAAELAALVDRMEKARQEMDSEGMVGAEPAPRSVIELGMSRLFEAVLHQENLISDLKQRLDSVLSSVPESEKAEARVDTATCSLQSELNELGWRLETSAQSLRQILDSCQL